MSRIAKPRIGGARTCLMLEEKAGKGASLLDDFNDIQIWTVRIPGPALVKRQTFRVVSWLSITIPFGK